jgi:hypothetical protein
VVAIKEGLVKEIPLNRKPTAQEWNALIKKANVLSKKVARNGIRLTENVSGVSLVGTAKASKHTHLTFFGAAFDSAVGTWIISGQRLFGDQAHGMAAATNREARNQGDSITWENVLFESGSYELAVGHQTDEDMGIMHWKIDDEEVVQIDAYRVSRTDVFTSLTSAFSVAGGQHDITCGIDSKNASSSNYQCNLAFFQMKRI